MSLVNLVSTLGEHIAFSIITSDRDINDHDPYPQLSPGDWIKQGHASVRYLDVKTADLDTLVNLVRDVAPDVIYLNSFFDTWFTFKALLARRLGRLPAARLVLAPRGEFSSGALDLKPARKRAYIFVLRTFGLLRNIEWHASTTLEAADIIRALRLPSDARIHVAADLGALPADGIFEDWCPRVPGSPLRLCFLSRISPMKNLLGAIRAVSHMRSPAQLDIYGPKEDLNYWAQCEEAIADLPGHISVRYFGPVTPSAVHVTLVAHDALFLPSLGENYGHVIPEALSVGLPVVASDQTPWKNLRDAGVGYDGPLDDYRFAAELDDLAALSEDDMWAMRHRARKFAREALTDDEKIEANRSLFNGR